MDNNITKRLDLTGCVDTRSSGDCGGGTVLIVDDEQVFREIARSVFMTLGFVVLAAKDGFEAVKIFRRHQDLIRLVLCDVMMPRMDGWETMVALRRLAPGIPVILSSGYNRAQVMTGDHLELPQVFLRKPFGLTELRKAIHESLKAEVLFD